jgi:hypothetical protein
LDFFFGEDAKDDDEVLTLFEALVGFLQGFGVDEAAVDLGPAGTGWDAFLMRLQVVLLATFYGLVVGRVENTYILQRSHALTYGVWVLWELLSRPLQYALWPLVVLFRWRVDDAHAVLPLLALTVVNNLCHKTSVH